MTTHVILFAFAMGHVAGAFLGYLAGRAHGEARA